MGKKGNPMRRFLHALGGIGALLVVIYLGYAVYVYYHEGVQEGVLLCEALDRCFLTMHVHADVDAIVCGERMKFPLETGLVDGPHTHKERNKIHFEGKPQVDSETKQLLNSAPLKIGTFMDALDTHFSKECFADKCNGDLCGDKPGTLRMWVNGKENKAFDNYVWKDDDQIRIVFE